MGVDFPVTEHEIHTLSVTIEKEELHIEADGQKILLHVENIYPVFHLGINACEGINRFYTLSIFNSQSK